MNETYRVERIVWERIRELIQIMNYVHPIQWNDIQPHASRQLMLPATNVKYLKLQLSFSSGTPNELSKTQPEGHFTGFLRQ